MAIRRNLWRLSVEKESSSCFTFSLRYYKDIAKLLFWVLWTCLAKQTQSDTITLQKTFVIICKQKLNLTPMLFWRYCKDFGCFGHVLLHTPKMIASTCKRLQCLHCFLHPLKLGESFSFLKFGQRGGSWKNCSE